LSINFILINNNKFTIYQLRKNRLYSNDYNSTYKWVFSILKNVLCSQNMYLQHDNAIFLKILVTLICFRVIKCNCIQNSRCLLTQVLKSYYKRKKSRCHIVDKVLKNNNHFWFFLYLLCFQSYKVFKKLYQNWNLLFIN
jgi:hypothetical protein